MDWETISSVDNGPLKHWESTSRMKLFRGWLVSHRVFKGSGGQALCTSVFVEDADYSWNIPEVPTKWEIIYQKANVNYRQRVLRLRIPFGWLILHRYDLRAEAEDSSISLVFVSDKDGEWMVN